MRSLLKEQLAKLFSTRPSEELHLYGIRAIACLLVIVHHACVLLNSPYSMVHLGRGAVGIFLVLSGYLLGNQLKFEINRDGTVHLMYFYVKRLARIVPVAYVAIIVISAFNHWAGLFPNANYWGLYTFSFNLLNLPVPPNLLHFWSLCVEMHCYALLPFLILIIHKIQNPNLRPGVLFILSSLLILVAFYCSNQDPAGQAYTTQTWLWCPVLGVAMAYKMPRPRFFAIAIAGALALGLFSKKAGLEIGPTRLFIALVGAFLISWGKYGGVRWLASRPFVILGKLSFSLYVYQQVVFFSGIPLKYIPLTGFFALLCTYLSYRYIELPSNRFRKVFATQRSSSGPKTGLKTSFNK